MISSFTSRNGKIVPTLQCSFVIFVIYLCISQVPRQYERKNRMGNDKLRAGLLQSSSRELQEKQYQVGLDFFIMGYPKTGTSSMMQYLDSNDELKIIGKNSNALAEYGISGEEDVKRLFDQIESAYLNSDKDGERYGIKWPGAISGKGMGGKCLELIKQYNPEGTETKLLIGMRHPVRWFESFYKYRRGGQPGSPPTTALIGGWCWSGVCTDRARFEEGIIQLGKLPLRPEDIQYEATHKNFGVIPGGTPYKVLLYLEEQLGNDDTERKSVFLNDLSSFLEVKEPFTVKHDVPQRNVDHNKHFDICEPQHKPVRDVLVKNGLKTAEWIRSNLHCKGIKFIM